MKTVPLDGLLLINKPKTWTSFDVCNFFKRRFHIAKVGHTGTLDPQATGVLIILLGRYTRMSSIFTEQRKTYRGTLQLGIRTDSQDGDGQVVEKKEWSHISPSDIQKMVPKFRGNLMQKPPMISAVKYHGKRLYKLARSGETVERELRPMTVYRFDIEGIRLPHVDFSVEVSKGTYVRTLAEDFGAALNSTAYLENLSRTAVGPYTLAECLEIKDIEKMKTIDELRTLIIRELREGLHQTSNPEIPASPIPR